LQVYPYILLYIYICKIEFVFNTFVLTIFIIIYNFISLPIHICVPIYVFPPFAFYLCWLVPLFQCCTSTVVAFLWINSFTFSVKMFWLITNTTVILLLTLVQNVQCMNKWITIFLLVLPTVFAAVALVLVLVPIQPNEFCTVNYLVLLFLRVWE